MCSQTANADYKTPLPVEHEKSSWVYTTGQVLSTVDGSTCTLGRISLSALRAKQWILFTHMQTFIILQKVNTNFCNF